eukprot:gene10476-biopygen1062
MALLCSACEFDGNDAVGGPIKYAPPPPNVSYTLWPHPRHLRLSWGGGVAVPLKGKASVPVAVKSPQC